MASVNDCCLHQHVTQLQTAFLAQTETVADVMTVGTIHSVHPDTTVDQGAQHRCAALNRPPLPLAWTT